MCQCGPVRLCSESPRRLAPFRRSAEILAKHGHSTMNIKNPSKPIEHRVSHQVPRTDHINKLFQPDLRVRYRRGKSDRDARSPPRWIAPRRTADCSVGRWWKFRAPGSIWSTLPARAPGSRLTLCADAVRRTRAALALSKSKEIVHQILVENSIVRQKLLVENSIVQQKILVKSSIV